MINLYFKMPSPQRALGHIKQQQSKQNHFKVRENQPTLHPIEYMKSCECGDTAFSP